MPGRPCVVSGARSSVPYRWFHTAAYVGPEDAGADEICRALAAHWDATEAATGFTGRSDRLLRRYGRRNLRGLGRGHSARFRRARLYIRAFRLAVRYIREASPRARYVARFTRAIASRDGILATAHAFVWLGWLAHHQKGPAQMDGDVLRDGDRSGGIWWAGTCPDCGVRNLYQERDGKIVVRCHFCGSVRLPLVIWHCPRAYSRHDCAACSAEVSAARFPKVEAGTPPGRNGKVGARIPRRPHLRRQIPRKGGPD